MDSPLLQTISSHTGFSYEVRVSAVPSIHKMLHDQPGHDLSIKMEKVVTEDCQSVSSVEDAEDIILALPTTITHEVDVPEEVLPEHYAGILIQALRYSNIIAATTRRGAGNVTLMGRDVMEKVEAAYKALGTEGFLPHEPEMVGRWEKRGTAIGMTIYTGDAIPADEVFVAYVGTGSAIDGPGGLIKDENGDLFLRLISNNSEALGNASDYVRRFRVVTK